MKVLKKIKRFVKNFLRATSREAMRDFDVLKTKLEGIVDAAQAEAREIKADIDEAYSKINVLKAKAMSELDEAARASWVAWRINELLK